MANSHSLILSSASSQYAEAADSTSLSITGDFTLELWVKFTTLPGFMVLMGKDKPDTSQRSFAMGSFYDGAHRLYGLISDDGARNSTFNSVWTPTVDTWYHIALRYTVVGAANAQFYVDGVAVGADHDVADWAPFDSTAKFVIGATESGSGYASLLNAKVEDVRVWNDARTALEISTNYQTELVGNEANLVAYWKLNNSYSDLTANANHLTPSGAPSFSTDVPFDATTTSTSSSTSTTTTSTSTTSTSTSRTTSTSTTSTMTSTSTTTTSTSTTTTSTSTTTTSTSTTSTSTTIDLKFAVEVL